MRKGLENKIANSIEFLKRGEEYYEIWKSKRSVKNYKELQRQTTIKFE